MKPCSPLNNLINDLNKNSHINGVDKILVKTSSILTGNGSWYKKSLAQVVSFAADWKAWIGTTDACTAFIDSGSVASDINAIANPLLTKYNQSELKNAFKLLQFQVNMCYLKINGQVFPPRCKRYCRTYMYENSNAMKIPEYKNLRDHILRAFGLSENEFNTFIQAEDDSIIKEKVQDSSFNKLLTINRDPAFDTYVNDKGFDIYKYAKDFMVEVLDKNDVLAKAFTNNNLKLLSNKVSTIMRVATITEAIYNRINEGWSQLSGTDKKVKYAKDQLNLAVNQFATPIEKFIFWCMVIKMSDR